jgi:hypothetical protein
MHGLPQLWVIDLPHKTGLHAFHRTKPRAEVCQRRIWPCMWSQDTCEGFRHETPLTAG